MFRVYIIPFSQYFGMNKTETSALFPENKGEWKYYESAPLEYFRYEGFFTKYK